MSDYTLILGDCLDKMSQIEDGSIDMILADLPYGTTACKWDVVIPFEPLWAHYKRVIKKNGAIVLFGSEPFSSLLRLSNLDWYKYDWVWDKKKPSNCLNGNKQPLRRTEEIAVFYQAQCTYHPQKIINPKGTEKRSRYAYNRLNEFGNTTGKIKQGGVSTNYEADKLLPIDILEFSKPSRPIHDTQKPVALLTYLILTYTNPGETVLDNVFGSCSTGEACLRTNRRFIGIEKDEAYYQIGVDRLARVVAELRGEFVPRPAKKPVTDLPMFKEMS